MMVTKLQSQIKEIIANGCSCDRYCETQNDSCGCLQDANAAIVCVLEEAVRIAETAGDKEERTSLGYKRIGHWIKGSNQYAALALRRFAQKFE